MLYRAVVLVLFGFAFPSMVWGQGASARFVPGANMRRDVRSAPEDFPGASKVGYFEVPSYWTAVVRRTRPGEVEIHKHVGDIWYAISGEAEVVTDGEITGARKTAPDEVRGKGLTNGHIFHMHAGDVLHVPAGVPHWVRRVDNEFIYFIVQVESH